MVARHNPPLIAARSFEAAARHKSFLKAAQELNVTPTAVSHQVKRLEDYLGQALFVRLNRAVELTEAGTTLAYKLSDIFARLDQALDPEVHRARSEIHISAMPSLAAKWLAPRLPGFEARYPQWAVRLEVADELVDFKTGHADLALRYGAGKYPGLHARLWMPANVFPVCSPALLARLPLDKPADLRHHTLIHHETSERPGSPPHWRDWLKAAHVGNVEVTRGPLFESIYMSLEAAQAGHGVALTPAPLVATDLASGRLVKPLTLEIANPYAFWIVCPRQHLQDPKVKALSAWLVEQAQQQ
ncbi:MAG TPA: transcriptional regulator GcvA [Telluria sp.]|nr:transcriptional regulator GcvA [Telluria sp.]